MADADHPEHPEGVAEPPGDAFSLIGPIYDRVMAPIPYDEWADYVELLITRWGGRKDRALDLACGTGSLALELMRRGSRVVGCDLAAGMVQAGRAKANEMAVDLPLVRMDMARLGFAPVFDLVVCLFDSLNYLLEWEALRDTFQGVKQALAPGGLFIFDLNTEFALAEELFTQEDLDEETDVKLRWKSRYNRWTRRTTVDMLFYLPDGSVVHETHEERAYTPKEVRRALAAAGLKTLAVYDAYSFDLPHRSSDRVFYVCRSEAETP